MEHNLKYSDLNMISPNGFPLKEFCLSGDESTPKVRKPYTISKQRERWTGEEHEKFLEGLKLHGRAWRKIEEHVGSKTSVQIRSHAQKFFSKVIKETSECNGDSTNTVEIPPPRPKRKPSHPYPRKLTNTFKKEILDSEKQETCTLAISSVSPKTRKLTLSVTSTPFSETVGSSISNVLNGYASPVLSAEASNQFEFLNTEKDTFLHSPSSFGYCKSSSLVELTADASSQDSCSTKLETGSKGSDCTTEEMSMDPSAVCIKLFGQTVVVPDSNRTSSSTNSTTPLDINPFANNESRRGDLESPSPNNLGVYFVHTLPATGTWDARPIGLAPMSYYSQFSQEVDPIRPFVHIPLWAWCGNLPLPFTSPKHTALGSCMENMDRSCSSSNSADTTDKHSDATNSISLFYLGRSDSFNSSKGFVPYKRCLSDKDPKESKVNYCEEPHERLPNVYV